MPMLPIRLPLLVEEARLARERFAGSAFRVGSRVQVLRFRAKGLFQEDNAGWPYETYGSSAELQSLTMLAIRLFSGATRGTKS